MRERILRHQRAGRREEVTDPVMASSTEELMVDGSFSPQVGTSQVHCMPAVASLEYKCPICLYRFDNLSHLDPCRHKFCFSCIQEWSKTKAECPLCKQPFHSIFHSLKAKDDFKEYIPRPTMNGPFASSDGHQFQYSPTLTRDCRIPIQPLRSSSLCSTFTPLDNEIMFEGLSNQTSLQWGRDINQIIWRLASRRQASTEGQFMRQIQEQELINFRRALYRSGVHVRNIQDGGQNRDISAEFFRKKSSSLHRLMPWLKRELTILFGSHGSRINKVQHIIMSNVTRYDMESQAFVEDLRPFLLHLTDHFLHEFINFARCPYSMEAYDQRANYDCPDPSYQEGRCSESAIIVISPDDADVRKPNVPSSRPEYSIHSYSESKDTKRARGNISSKQYHHDRYHSRSRYSSCMSMSRTAHTHSDKPSGKRKYKTHHLENEEKEASYQETQHGKEKEDSTQVGKSSQARCTWGYNNESIDFFSEPKQKWRKKEKSHSVEIVYDYEGKAAEGTRHQKKKHNINSDSKTPMNVSGENDSNTFLSIKNYCTGSTIPVSSRSLATSETASTTDMLTGEEGDAYFKGYDLSSSSRHLDAITEILGSLHFDDSSGEHALSVAGPLYVQCTQRLVSPW
ncbi:E3 ubiquitin-protein ligase Topors-like [Ascaphus truei]|uniref:E3 ubiquitin-protein ligase Topors-like n=1 Tax=Ascaphus truei TaxID=8439 RepID=UPI003F59DF32